jgi:hypothetical protein
MPPLDGDSWSLLAFRVTLKPAQVTELEGKMRNKYKKEMDAGAVIVRYTASEKHLELRQKFTKGPDAIEFIKFVIQQVDSLKAGAKRL